MGIPQINENVWGLSVVLRHLLDMSMSNLVISLNDY